MIKRDGVERVSEKVKKGEWKKKRMKGHAFMNKREKQKWIKRKTARQKERVKNIDIKRETD